MPPVFLFVYDMYIDSDNSHFKGIFVDNEPYNGPWYDHKKAYDVKPKEENKVFDFVEQMPSFPDGNAALMNYLSQNIKYPVIAEENGIQGRVIVQFVVGKDGHISDVRVAKSVDPSLDKEAVRVVKGMPKWIPGKQNGQTVTVRYTLPVTFRLN